VPNFVNKFIAFRGTCKISEFLSLLLFVCWKMAIFFNYSNPLCCTVYVGNLHSSYYTIAVMSDMTVRFCDDFEMWGADCLVS
jgi:hypothetical protein